ncbi:protein SET DOMAIN GROUP 41-like [Rosa rugosa]|uniref:protein SET DOMAIN GROUP 41-like n=1 Tax=Rosa rugosa TaxID=74645 RepID=UPI002B40588C|nr:protein SET DOMAIN GROUP 41-like [Rosa rugosa]
MEMEMRAEEEIELGQDLTPSLPPLSFALHDSLLSSHCSSCFSSLPPQPFPPLHTPPFPNNSHHVHYCSPLCSASDSPLHLSSAEPRLLLLLHSHPHGDSSDLRAALRLLHSLPATSPPALPRISGLLTNRLRFIDHDDDLRIRDGARAMFLARTMRDAQDDDDAVLEEAVLCLVLTNAVEVQDNTGRTLGIAVYDSCFSWINHSCSPNACYRFLLSSPSPPQCAETPLRIVPAGQIEGGVCSKNLLTKECGKYGPRVIVRSIKRINRGDEVTITYTDLLQPKAMRQSELWSRYRFVCSCKRCSASPLTHVDHALEDIYAVNFNSSRLSSDISFNRDKATERLTDYIDDAIADYLSIGNPESSCQRLEQVLTQGLSDNQQEGNEEKSELTFWLNPLHHLSLNAYTTLASAYKILADDQLTLSSSIESIGNHVMKAFGMSRTSAAYSLLLAGAAHHLFNSESSLVVNVAHFWTIAGDSLLNLAKSSLWSEINRWDLPVSDHLELYRIAKYKCPKCSLMDKFETYSFHDPVKHADFEHASKEFLDCVTNLTQKVWYFLVQGCRYLGLCKNPIDFCWLDTSKYSSECEVLTQSTGTNCGNKRSFSGSEAEEDTNQLRMYVLYLGVHCLLYGEFLASICYGRYSHLTCHVLNILDREEKSSNPCH